MLAIALAPTTLTQESRVRINLRCIHLINFSCALCDRGEFHRLQKSDEVARLWLMQAQIIEWHLHIHIIAKRDELARDADEINRFRIGQCLAALGLLDFCGTRQQRFKIAIIIDQLRSCLDANAGRAGHIIR